MNPKPNLAPQRDSNPCPLRLTGSATTHWDQADLSSSIESDRGVT